MSYRRQLNQVNVVMSAVSDKDLEKQFDGAQEIIWWILKTWNKIFVVSCVIAVSVDPLFLYIPVIIEHKCIGFDRTLQIITIWLRSVTDLFYVVNIILRLYFLYYVRKSSQELGSTKLVTNAPEMQFYSLSKQVSSKKLGRAKSFTNASEIVHRYRWGYFLVDILSILPIPQVVVSTMFLKMESSNYLDTRLWFNLLVFFQYVPRVLRIYLSWMELIKIGSKFAERIKIKAAFNFFLYILGSHVLGAFWYFLSIERETACWLRACKTHKECVRSSFNCKKNPENYTFLNDLCPINTPNQTLFDFGIFLQALESGTLEAIDFPKKLLYCFWWGLRNVSSFGQNLQTSTYFWENCFAVFISIYGLILFLFFVGNLQVYLSSKATKTLTKKEFRLKKNEKMRIKKLKIGEWVFRNKLPRDIKRKILSEVEHLFEENKGVDVENLFVDKVDVENLLPLLSPKLRKDITLHLCLPLLNKVPILLQKMGGEHNEKKFFSSPLIWKYLKPVYYNENSDIVQAGEALDKMLLIISGTLLTSNGSEGHVYLGKGDFIGEELLKWGFNNDSPPCNLSSLPICEKTVKTHTKVEAFILTAKHLKELVDNIKKAPAVLQRAWRRKHGHHHHHHHHCHHCHHQPDQPQSVPGDKDDANLASPSGTAK